VKKNEPAHKKSVSKTKRASISRITTIGRCTHTTAINLEKAVKRSQKPSDWKCFSCGKLDDMWLCVSCGNIGCGRKRGGHAKKHFEKKGHPVVLSLSMKAYFCYACDEWVVSDNMRGELSLVRNILRSVQSDSFDAPRTRSGHIRGEAQSVWRIRGRSGLPFFKPKKDGHLDMEYTAGVLARNSLLMRVFASWKSYALVRGGGVGKGTTSTSRGKRRRRGGDKRRRSSRIRRRVSTSVSKHSTRLCGRVGLRNLGNSCYLNAVVQSISNMTAFRDLILSLGDSSSTFPVLESVIRDDDDDDDDDDKVSIAALRKPVLKRLTTEVCRAHSESKSDTRDVENDASRVSIMAELYSLLRCLWTSKAGRKAVLTPSAMMHAVWHSMPRFRSYDQQDAHEFFIDLTDAIDEEMKRSDVPSSSSQQRRPLSAIYRLIGFEHLSTVTCRTCARASPSIGRSVCLSVPICVSNNTLHRDFRGRRRRSSDSAVASRHRRRRCRNETVSVEECLTSVTRTEILANSQKVYFCERCRKKQSATKQWLLRSLPSILVLHVNRAKWLSNGGKTKLQNHVSFPFSLDMGPFLSSNSARTSTTTTATSNVYDLSAVVVHRGRGVDTGHYMTYCYDKSRDTWLEFDDLSVRVCSKEDVKESQAYLLFYTRNGGFGVVNKSTVRKF